MTLNEISGVAFLLVNLPGGGYALFVCQKISYL